MAKASKAGKVKKLETAQLRSVRQLVDRLGGSRICYGEPVKVGDRAIIPVSRVRAAGGGGWGAGGTAADRGLGGGGGGSLDATPVGFIDVGPEGSHFQAIPDADAPARTLAAGAKAFATIATAAAGVLALRRGRALRGGRSPRGLLNR